LPTATSRWARASRPPRKPLDGNGAAILLLPPEPAYPLDPAGQPAIRGQTRARPIACGTLLANQQQQVMTEPAGAKPSSLLDHEVRRRGAQHREGPRRLGARGGAMRHSRTLSSRTSLRSRGYSPLSSTTACAGNASRGREEPSPRWWSLDVGRDAAIRQKLCDLPSHGVTIGRRSRGAARCTVTVTLHGEAPRVH